MKKIVILLALLFALVGCQSAPATLDAESLQNTAVAVAWTSVSKTQIASTPPTQTPTPKPSSTPRPSATPFAMPQGDFEMSWDTYNSQYDSSGAVVTIRKQGSRYTEKIVMPDGSSGNFDLTLIHEGNTIKLDGHFGDSYSLSPHDYIQIESNGWLGFYDDMGLIYKVPPLK